MKNNRGVDSKTILIIDEQSYFQQKHHQLISSLGCNLMFSDKSLQGIEIAKQRNLDLVIINWELPNLIGLETINQIKAQEINKFTPILICSEAIDNSNELSRVMKRGTVDFIRKPLDEIELIARVNTSIQLSVLLKENQEKLNDIFDQKNLLLNEQNKLLAKIFEHDEKEQEMHVSQVFYLNQAFSKMKESIEHITQKCDKHLAEMITQEIERYQPLLNNDNIWDEFHIRFLKNHEGFEERIKTEYPNLTFNDFKLCVFIRNKMSSKDIALLTFSNYDSVRKAKQRLRKKLMIEDEVNIDEFIGQI